MDDNKTIAIISSSLGGFDKVREHVPQSIPYDYFLFTDDNFPPREKALMPRLQAKIPKIFGWQLKPDYKYYLYIDGNLTLAHEDSLKYFYDNCQGYDVVVLKHHRRPNIWKEARYLEQGLDEQSIYLVSRYKNEFLKEQMNEIFSDKDFVDDMLVIGGVFMYRNTPEVHAMLKEWWYHVSRYIIQDQISFSYVLKKSGLRVNILPDIYCDCKWLKNYGHLFRNK